MKSKFATIVSTTSRLSVIASSLATILSFGYLFLTMHKIDMPYFEYSISILGGLVGLAVPFLYIKMLRRSRRIFVSFSNSDAAFASRLSKNLTDSHYTLVSTSSIAVGDRIAVNLNNMIVHSDAVLFVVSDKSLKSDWMKQELKFARDNGKPIIPVVLNTNRVPKAFADIKYADFTNEKEGLHALNEALQKL